MSAMRWTSSAGQTEQENVETYNNIGRKKLNSVKCIRGTRERERGGGREGKKGQDARALAKLRTRGMRASNAHECRR